MIDHKAYGTELLNDVINSSGQEEDTRIGEGKEKLFSINVVEK